MKTMQIDIQNTVIMKLKLTMKTWNMEVDWWNTNSINADQKKTHASNRSPSFSDLSRSKDWYMSSNSKTFEYPFRNSDNVHVKNNTAKTLAFSRGFGGNFRRADSMTLFIGYFLLFPKSIFNEILIAFSEWYSLLMDSSNPSSNYYDYETNIWLNCLAVAEMNCLSAN